MKLCFIFFLNKFFLINFLFLVFFENDNQDLEEGIRPNIAFVFVSSRYFAWEDA